MYLTLITTRNCNLKCKYCYEGNKKKQNPQYKLEDLMKFIYFYKPNSIGFFGGEPLMNMDYIKSVVNEIRKRELPIRFGITTNGTLITDEIAGYLSANGFNAIVSIDGDKETHNQNRGNSYDDVIKGIQLLQKYYINPNARMTVNRDNVGKLYENYLHILSLGIDDVAMCWDKMQEPVSHNDMQMYQAQLKLIFDDWKLRRFADKQVRINLMGITVFPEAAKNQTPCLFGHDIMALDIDGQIYPCHMAIDYPELSMGNLEKGLDVEKIKDYAKITGQNFICDPMCESKSICHRVCYMQNYIRKGNILIPSARDCFIKRTELDIVKGYLI